MAGEVKALALFSGGLDSILAARLILDQGITVEGIYFINAFLTKDLSEAQQAAERIKLKLHIVDISEEHLRMTQNPKYGYGENINPCVDCRILMFKKAKAYMQRHHFSFLISGEVLGQRPMSQRRDALNIVDQDAHLTGLVLRPLSARLLATTFAEEKGWVERERLFSFSGRSRKPQLTVAKDLGIEEYPSPAGGCLLTEVEFTRKFKDLIASGKFAMQDVQLLRIGRHFRLQNYGKIIVGRNEQENKSLIGLVGDKDILFKARDFSGPLTAAHIKEKYLFPSLLDKLQTNGSLLETAAALTAYYGKGKKEEKVRVDFWQKDSTEKKSILVSPAQEQLVEKLRV